MLPSPEARSVTESRIKRRLGEGMMSVNLVLVRHGQSEWNLKNLFTGWKDPDLTPLGEAQAEQTGAVLKTSGMRFDCAYVSGLKRAQHTLALILEALNQEDLPIFKSEALNERDYGDLSGMNKAEAVAKWGEEQVALWRRSYDVPPPGGESLKDTVARVLPYYVFHIQPRLLSREKVLIVAHGNSLRALMMALEGLSPQEITKRELETGAPVLYTIGRDSRARLTPLAL